MSLALVNSTAEGSLTSGSLAREVGQSLLFTGQEAGSLPLETHTAAWLRARLISPVTYRVLGTMTSLCVSELQFSQVGCTPQ